MFIHPVAVVGLLFMVALGCAGKGTQPAAVEAARGPVIVRLVGQHQTITVTSGPDGPLYTAQTTAGQTIVANATLEQLRQEHPEVYRFVEPSIAVQADVGPAVPDRSLPAAFRGPTRSMNSQDVLMLDSAR